MHKLREFLFTFHFNTETTGLVWITYSGIAGASHKNNASVSGVYDVDPGRIVRQAHYKSNPVPATPKNKPVVYTQNSSDAFRRLRRRGFGQKLRTETLNFDNFKFFFGGKFFRVKKTKFSYSMERTKH